MQFLSPSMYLRTFANLMIWLYLALLLFLSLAGGFTPFLFKKFKASWITLLLAFSGSFLLSITILHLLPETFEELGHQAGIFVIAGFLLQLLLQRISHGVEHGHVHTPNTHTHTHAIGPIFVGLCIHAFMEGIPLGFNYRDEHTIHSLFLGVAAHKLPEAITFSSLLLTAHKLPRKYAWVIGFAFVSPIAGLLAMYYGQKFYFISNLLIYIIPIVSGAFLHISTTILYESGTRQHELSRQKVVVVLLGFIAALLTLLFHVHE